MKKIAMMFVIMLSISSCQSQEKKNNTISPIQKTDADWKKELTPEQYEVLREKGTERPFSGEYVNTFEKGEYVCAACANVLFYSDAKFHSDCGWPSFDKAIKGSVTYVTDTTLGMTRTEVNCARCGGHLGHVFEDGPTETGQRFCTNSVSVKFIPRK